MQIWIYLDGIRQGPYTIKQIRLLPIDASTPVWYEGLADWTAAGEAPATADMFADIAPASPEVGETPSAHTPTASQQTSACSGGAAQEKTNQTSILRRPHTFLIWNILLTIFFWCPIALAGVITGVLSFIKFSSGRYTASVRLSSATEWLLMIAVVWSVVSIPILMAVALT